MPRPDFHGLTRSAPIAAEIADATFAAMLHGRRHCRHPTGCRVEGCSACNARVAALNALGDLDDALDRVELVIERMIDALDLLGDAAPPEDCIGCSTVVERGTDARQRYALWLRDTDPPHRGA